MPDDREREATRQERREDKLARRRRGMRVSGGSLRRIYPAAILKRLQRRVHAAGKRGSRGPAAAP